MQGSIKKIFLFVFLGISVSQGAHALADDWQRDRLFQPTPAQRSEEAKGKVFIYHGLKDREVSRALDEQFPRVEFMMFTGTVITDGRGLPMKDPETGEDLVEEDGCD